MRKRLRYMKFGIMMGIMLIGLLITMVSVPDEAEAAPTLTPIATIGLVQSQQTADVSPGSLGIVTFDGTVTCVVNSATTAIVQLEATDTWTSAVVTPSAIEFSNTNAGAKTFQVSVKAPLYTSRNVVGQVVVSGKVIMYPGRLYGTVQPTDGVKARIDIDSFYKFQINAPKKYQEVGPGQQMVYNVHVINQGNIRDTFEIDIENEEQLTKAGFVLTLSQRVIDVEELEEKVIKLTVNTPIEWNVWKNKVTGVKVSVVSTLSLEESGNPLTQIEYFKIRERGASVPGFDPTFLIMSFVGLAIIVRTRTLKRRRQLK